MVWRPVSGDSETTAERLIEVAQARFTFFNLIPDGPGRLERFAAEVMPAGRRQAGRVA
jgi:alkanesulfonate monooxygenase SsuD/methylene tetrahydromethanopterin reductase-like flavin-dependent oxidoreductase (luciferase family)